MKNQSRWSKNNQRKFNSNSIANFKIKLTLKLYQINPAVCTVGSTQLWYYSHNYSHAILFLYSHTYSIPNANYIGKMELNPYEDLPTRINDRLAQFSE